MDLVGFFMAGFLIGIVYANLGGADYIATIGIFHEYFLNQYLNQDIWKEGYFFYLLQQRMAPVCLLIFASMTKFRKIAAAAWLIWTGIAGGMIAVAAVVRMGLIGMLYYVATLFPHSVFYIFGYFILMYGMMHSERMKWNLWSIFFLGISFFAGILSEVYVNPQVLCWVMQIIC